MKTCVSCLWFSAGKPPDDGMGNPVMGWVPIGECKFLLDPVWGLPSPANLARQDSGRTGLSVTDGTPRQCGITGQYWASLSEAAEAMHASVLGEKDK